MNVLASVYELRVSIRVTRCLDSRIVGWLDSEIAAKLNSYDIMRTCVLVEFAWLRLTPSLNGVL